MAETTVDIILRAKDEASRLVRNVESRLSGLNESLESVDGNTVRAFSSSAIQEFADAIVNSAISAVQRFGTSAENASESFDGIADTDVSGIVDDLETVEEDLERIEDAALGAGSATSEGFAEVDERVTEASESVSGLSDRISNLREVAVSAGNEISGVWGTVSNQISGATGFIGTALNRFGVATAGISGGIQAIGTAVNARLSTALAENATLVDATETSFESLRTTVREVAAEINGSQFEVARAQYTALSAAAGDVALSNEVLRESARLAVAGVTSIDTAVTALAPTLNAYGAGNLSAAEASNILFRTVQGGITNVDELAGSLGRITPIAASLGIPLGDVGAAIATVTSGGVGTAEALTSLNAAITSLLRPTDELNDLFVEFGGVEEAISDLGIQEVFRIIADETGRSAAALTELLGSAIAVQGVLNLTRNEGQAFADSLAAVNQEADSVGEALGTVRQQTGRAFTELTNSVVAFESAIGAALERFVVPFVRGITAIVNSITQLIERFPLLAGALGITVVAFGTLIAAVGAAVAALAGILANVFIVSAAVRVLTGQWGLAGAAVGAFQAALTGGLGPLDAFRSAIRSVGIGLGILGTGAAAGAARITLLQRALNLVRASAVRARVAVIALGRAFLGPIGIGLFALTAAFNAFAGSSDEAEQRAAAVARRLEELGVRSEEAANGVESLQQLLTRLEDIGVSDNFLSGLRETIEEIREGIIDPEDVAAVVDLFRQRLDNLATLNRRREEAVNELAELEIRRDKEVADRRLEEEQRVLDELENRRDDITSQIAEFQGSDDANIAANALTAAVQEGDGLEAQRAEAARARELETDALNALGQGLRAATIEEANRVRELIRQTTLEAESIQNNERRVDILESLAAAERGLNRRFDDLIAPTASDEAEAAVQNQIQVVEEFEDIVGRLTTRLQELDGEDVDVDINVQVEQARQRLSTIEANISRLQTSVVIAVTTDDEGVRNINEPVLAQVRELDEIQVSPDVTIDDLAAQTSIQALEASLSQLERARTIPVNIDTTGAAIATEEPDGFATGGRIPGYGGGDRVPALLESGEFVVRKERARKFSRLLEMINSGALRNLRDIPRFRTGGMVGGSPFDFSGLIPDLPSSIVKGLEVPAFRSGGPVDQPSSAVGNLGTVNLTIADDGPFPLFADQETMRDIKDFVYRQSLKKGRRRR